MNLKVFGYSLDHQNLVNAKCFLSNLIFIFSSEVFADDINKQNVKSTKFLIFQNDAKYLCTILGISF